MHTAHGSRADTQPEPYQPRHGIAASVCFVLKRSSLLTSTPPSLRFGEPLSDSEWGWCSLSLPPSRCCWCKSRGREQSQSSGSHPLNSRHPSTDAQAREKPAKSFGKPLTQIPPALPPLSQAQTRDLEKVPYLTANYCRENLRSIKQVNVPLAPLTFSLPK